MKTRTSFLSMLLVVLLISTSFGVSVSFQNDVGGYYSQQAVGWNGNYSGGLPVHTPYAKGSIHSGTGYIDNMYFTGTTGTRHYVQAIRFDDIVGDGPGLIPENAIIDSATMTLTLTTLTSISDTTVYRAYRNLVDWSEGDLGANFGPATATSPRGPDLATPDPGEVTSTYITSAPTAARKIIFDMASSIEYLLDNPSDRYGWTIARDTLTNGGPIFLDYANAGTPAGTVPLLEVNFSLPPVPEPSSFLLLGLGVLGLVRHARRSRRPGA